MDEIEELRAKLKELYASKYKRFNVKIHKDIFQKLEAEAEKQGKSKAKMLAEMIRGFNY